MPNRKIFLKEVESITLPGAISGFQVFPNHAPLVSSLVSGCISYISSNSLSNIEIKQGFVLATNIEIKQGFVL